MTTKEPNYKTALVPVKPGKMVTTVDSSPLDLIIGGLPEQSRTKGCLKIGTTLRYFFYLEIEGQKLIKIARFGKFDIV